MYLARPAPLCVTEVLDLDDLHMIKHDKIRPLQLFISQVHSRNKYIFLNFRMPQSVLLLVYMRGFAKLCDLPILISLNFVHVRALEGNICMSL